MVFTPNDPLGRPDRDADLRTTPIDRRRSGPWAFIILIAFIAIAGFAYYNYGTPGTDPQTTASTNQAEPTAVPAPATPVAPTGAMPQTHRRRPAGSGQQ